MYSAQWLASVYSSLHVQSANILEVSISSSGSGWIHINISRLSGHDGLQLDTIVDITALDECRRTYRFDNIGRSWSCRRITVPTTRQQIPHSVTSLVVAKMVRRAIRQ